MPHEQYQHDPQPDQQSDFVSTPSVARTDKDLVIKDFYNFTDIGFSNERGQTFARIGVRGAAYSVSASQYLIGVTALAVSTTIGLPRPKLVGVGTSFIVKDEVGGAATTTITIVSQGEELIDGGANTTLNTNYQAKSLYTDGANWFVY